ncbi:two component transcriptional regulator, winged helix family [Actinobacteria bacterium OK006]|nr:two component transcriptional regulator, winged helix family [Actinobacteria bacterium OK006]
MSGTRSERLHATRAPGDPTRGERPGGHRVPGERVLDDGDGARVRGERDGGERLHGGRDGGERPRGGHDGGEYVHGDRAGVRGGREGGDHLRSTRASGDPDGDGARVRGERDGGDRPRVGRDGGEYLGGDRLRGERTRGERTRGDRVRVLIVDDEPALTELLSVAVTEAGWRPYPVADGHSALRAARGCAPHAVVLDGMLPDLDGIQVLRRLRYENPRLPVLMLTARDALEHRIDSLSSGADDYVTKPFSLEEVVLRLRGLLRRAGAEPLRADDSVLVLGDLVLREETREVRRDGTPIQLTAKEFDLLGLLLGHPRQVLSKAQILDHVWGSSFDGGGNLVEVYISSLRRKIDKGRAPMIHTVRGVGYAIRPVEDGR